MRNELTKMKKALSILGVVALSTSFAVAAPHGGKHNDKQKGKGKSRAHQKQGKEKHEQKLARELNLTEAQQHEVRELRKRFRDENKDLMTNMKQLREESRTARKAGDVQRADAIARDIRHQRETLRARREQQRRQMLMILTPEQRERFDALHRERGERRSR